MMKKYLVFGMMSAIALSFTACTSEDDLVEVNPTYDAETNTVNTRFVLNVATPTQTRMSDETVQKAENFRGIQDARIFVLKTGNAGYLAPYCAIDDPSNESFLKSIELGTLYSPTMVDNSDDKNKDESSRRILELAMPLTADAMLIYGRAIPSGEDKVNGKLETTVLTAEKPDGITFNLSSIIADNKTLLTNTQNLAATVFNRLFKAELEATSAVYNANGYTSAAALPAISLKGLATKLANSDELTPLEEILADAFSTVTKIGPKTSGTEYRAGSANAVLTQVYYLNKTAQNIKRSTPTNDAEANAWRLADELATRIARYFTDLDSPTTTKFVAVEGSTNSIQTNLVNASAATAADFAESGKFAGVTQTYLNGFPNCFGLPAGSSQMTFDETNLFSYKSEKNSLTNPFDNTTAVEDYKFPAELYYYDNSSIYTSDVEKAEDDFPNGYNTWDTYEWNNNGFTGNTVTSSTRSVAVKSNINYGVAMLESKVALTSTSFKDNKKTFITTEEDQEFTDTDIKKLQLTGVLIGGQPQHVHWPYINMDATPKFGDVVYDNDVPNNGVIPTATGEENYTLLLDNCVLGATTQSDVFVALEFKNGMGDFYGKQNLVRNGGVFYLLAKLEMPASSTLTWDDYYAIPPYNRTSGKTNGQSVKLPRIFIQDYVTTATFKITAESLKNAYVTVPDLRATQTSMALSVDLNWRQGISFDDVTLGQ